MNQDGVSRAQSGEAWTGTGADGTALPEQSCSDWSGSGAATLGQTGSANTNSDWTEGLKDLGCRDFFASGHFYCFEQ
ncbi:MAG: hypothetical protein ACI9MR_003357 [Myxococcota bacterium]|jgi:hypothetical protein